MRHYSFRLPYQVMLLLFLWVFTGNVYARETLKNGIELQPGLIALKFQEGSGIRLADTPGNKILPGQNIFESPHDLSGLESYLKEHEILSVRPIFTSKSVAEFDDLAQRLSLASGRRIPNLNLHFSLRFPEDADTQKIADDLRSFPFITDVMASIVVPPPVAVPDDPQAIDAVVSGQWYLFRTNVDQAWRGSDGSNVTIADCDAGFELTHSDLYENFRSNLQQDYGNPGDDVQDGYYMSHGTSVMGILAAMSNSAGIAGAAHETKVIPLQYWNYDGTDTSGDFGGAIGNCILGAYGKGAKLIVVEAQSGTGSAETFPAVRDAAATVVAAGVHVVAAAGNYNKELTAEASYDTGSIIVGATDLNDERAHWGGSSASNYGSRVDVGAPGDSQQYTTYPNNSYTQYFGGTSGATPIVAGAVTLLLSADPTITPSAMRDIIRNTATPITTDQPIGGLLNAEEALIAVIGELPGSSEESSFTDETSDETGEDSGRFPICGVVHPPFSASVLQKVLLGTLCFCLFFSGSLAVILNRRS